MAGNRLVTVAAAAVAAMLLLSTLMLSTSSVPRLSAMTAPLRGTKGSDAQLQEKLTLAEKIWSQSVMDREQMISQSGDRDFPDGYISPYHVWDFARPSFTCPYELERIGSLSDGGKVVCGMSHYEKVFPGPSVADKKPELVIYSFGVNHDSSFEAAMMQRTNARIWGYDFSVDSWGPEIPRHQYANAHFEKMGISKATDLAANPPMSSVRDLMRENGHDYVDVVKMDIEGAEFDALTSLIQSVRSEGNGSLPFGQLLVELHFFPDPPGSTIPKSLKQWTEWWSSLEAMGLRPVNNEGNWLGDNSYGKPRFMEYTLINVDQRNERNKLLQA